MTFLVRRRVLKEVRKTLLDVREARLPLFCEGHGAIQIVSFTYQAISHVFTDTSSLCPH